MQPQVSKEHYFRKKYDDLNRFISYFYQIDLLLELIGDRDVKVLEIGKGNGTVSDHLKKSGVKVTTVDINPELRPDVVADIRKLPFSDQEFDAVMACEVLEHLPFEEFPQALAEIERVSKGKALISLPYRSTGFECVLKFPLIRSILKNSFFDLFLRIPLKFGGIKVSGQHYWEIDCWKYSLRKVRKEIRKKFQIIKEASPLLNHYHQFFVLARR